MCRPLPTKTPSTHSLPKETPVEIKKPENDCRWHRSIPDQIEGLEALAMWLTYGIALNATQNGPTALEDLSQEATHLACVLATLATLRELDLKRPNPYA